jgi:glycosyltransferase EpsJ
MNSTRPAISVIVPIYNVEKYLSKCIDTILKQPFKNYELILVNDGSPDNCSAICKGYSIKDNRIRVINKENGGLSSARNAGIDIATGKYIVFVDPDDQICDEYLNNLYSIAESNNCDAVISGYTTIPNNKRIVPGYKLDTVLNGRDFVLSSKHVHSNNDLCFVWRYIYKLNIILEKKLRFNEKVFYGEDVIFNLEFLLNSRRVYAISEGYYYYTVNNPESLMRMKYKPKLEKSLEIQYKVRKNLSEKFYLNNNSDYKKDMADYYINHIFSMMVKNLKSKKETNSQIIKSDFKKIINYKMFRESIREIGLFYKCGTIKEYIYYLALKYKIYPILIEHIGRKSVGDLID